MTPPPPPRPARRGSSEGAVDTRDGGGRPPARRLAPVLQRLVEADGTSGCEEEVREVVYDEVKGVCDIAGVDGLGNLIARVRRGPGRGGTGDNPVPRIMLAAHMDEVGLMIKHVRPDGYLAFELSGFVDPGILPSQWVRIATSKGKLRGVVATKAAHFAREDSGEGQRRSTLLIDVGARSREEALGMGVKPGDHAVYDRGLALSGNGRFFVGKALDNRVGCAVMVESTKEVAGEKAMAGDVYAVGTVREEVGASGARVAANRLRPDVAIVLDGLPASDPYVPLERSPVEVGRGPVIRRAELQVPNASVTPRWLFDLAVGVAEEERIPYQVDTSAAYYSDASPISASGFGVPVVPILVARQNSHSPAEVASAADVDLAVRLTSALVRKLSRSARLFESGLREGDR